MRTSSKRLILDAFLLTLIFFGCTPDPKSILEKSFEKCQSIENGYYEMTKYVKLQGRIDTIEVSQKTYFKKQQSDTPYTFIFHSEFFSEDLGGMVNILYTGNEIVLYVDSLGSITPKKDREYDIRNIFIKNTVFALFWPITNTSSFPLPDNSALISNNIKVTLLKEENIQGSPCYLINMKVQPDYDNTVLEQHGLTTKIEYLFWIDKKNHIPLQYVVHKNIDVENQYEKYTLTKFDFNSLEDDTRLTLQSLPENIHLSILPEKESVKDELLEIGMPAPDWELPLVSGGAKKLSDLKGDMVLLNFFYTSCPPCVKEMPHLNKLHEKYVGKGLHVIGINLINYNINDINYFINKHNITFPTLMGTEDIKNRYNILYFPTTYLIDREGKIIYRQVGFDDKMPIDITIQNYL